MCFYPEHPEHPERFCKSAIRSPCFHRAAVLYVELQFIGETGLLRYIA